MHQQGGAHADGKTVHCGDQRFFACNQMTQEAEHRRVLALGRIGEKVLQVVSRGEAAAFSGEQHGLDCGIVGCAFERGIDRLVHRHGQGVFLFRAVEHDVQHAALQLGLDQTHRCLLKKMPGLRCLDPGAV
ncbi:hypothetical protein GALL_511260 [mine drainage metagenome]|uniref:Uncharacterized protein n=1 Tax=mine drainage metagenome TaxID=410659 RepID=A0A1J5PHL9_9ZZZZ